MTFDVDVRLDVGETALSVCDGAAVARRVETGLTGLLAGLGLSATVTATVAPVSDGAALAVLWRGSEELGTFLMDEIPSLSVLGKDVEVSVARWEEILGQVAHRLAAQDVLRLLGPAAESLGETARHLLDLWIRVPEELPDGSPEEVVAALRPVPVRLRIAPDYLRGLTTMWHDNVFRTVRRRLRRRLGVAPPRLHFEAAPDVPGLMIQPVVNDVDMMPVEGIAPDLLAVEAKAERLRDMGIEATQVERVSLVPVRHAPELGDLTQWTAIELVGYWWELFAPTVAWRTFDQRDVVETLEWLRPELPTLARLADLVPPAELAGRLRPLYRRGGGLPMLAARVEDVVGGSVGGFPDAGPGRGPYSGSHGRTPPS